MQKLHEVHSHSRGRSVLKIPLIKRNKHQTNNSLWALQLCGSWAWCGPWPISSTFCCCCPTSLQMVEKSEQGKGEKSSVSKAWQAQQHKSRAWFVPITSVQLDSRLDKSDKAKPVLTLNLLFLTSCFYPGGKRLPAAGMLVWCSRQLHIPHMPSHPPTSTAKELPPRLEAMCGSQKVRPASSPPPFFSKLPWKLSNCLHLWSQPPKAVKKSLILQRAWSIVGMLQRI